MSAEQAVGEASEDLLLGGRVRLLQPLAGDRAAIDPVLLAAAVPARAGEHVLDAGTGSGAAALCLAARLPEVEVTGLDIAGDLVTLATVSAARNGWAQRVRFVEGDIDGPRPSPLTFDHAMANPPYERPGTGRPSPDQARARAHVEGEVELPRWIQALTACIREGGSVTLIHRADRLADILVALAGGAGARVGGIIVFPLWPADGKPAKRVLIRWRKGSREPLRIASGLVLHRPEGGFTAATDAILRDAETLVL